MQKDEKLSYIPVLLTETIDCPYEGLMPLINGVNTVSEIASKKPSLNTDDIISFVEREREAGKAVWLHEWSPLYWCHSCNLPLIQDHCDKCGSRDVENILLKFTCNPRPVASGDEKMFRDAGLPWPVDSSWVINSYVRPDYWGHQVICDGKVIGDMTVSKIDRDFSFHPAEGVNIGSLKGEKSPPVTMQDLIEANRSRLEYIEEETVGFIKQKMKEYPKYRPWAATSGGKDSVVNIHLCSLASDKMQAISIDTGIHPACHEAFHRDLFKRYPGMKLLTVSGGDVFWRGLERLGPPANDFQWCKTIIKLDVPRKALRKRLRFFTHLKRLLPFIRLNRLVISGQRRREDIERVTWGRMKQVKEGDENVQIHPIYEWTDLDLWMYIHKNQLPIHPEYDEGKCHRMVCSFCPGKFNHEIDVFKENHPELWGLYDRELKKWQKTFGYPDEWVSENLWVFDAPISKHMQELGITSHLDFIAKRLASCIELGGVDREGEAYLIKGKLKDDVDLKKLANWLMPFGKVKLKGGIEVVSPDGLSLEIAKNGDITIKGPGEEQLKEYGEKIRLWIESYVNCIACGACIPLCKYINIDIDDKTNKVRILSRRACKDCGECIDAVIENCLLNEKGMNKGRISYIKTE